MSITNVRNTCPNIDKLIRHIKRWDNEDLISEIDRIYLIDILEELRSSNSELQELQNQLSDAESTIIELDDYITMLEASIE